MGYRRGYRASLGSTATNTGHASTGSAGAIPFDYNADGHDDLLVPYSGGTWWVMLGSASGLGAPQDTGAPATGVTFFPSTMNEASVMRAVREAYESSTKIGVQGTDRILLKGQGAGLSIEMWFNKVTKTIETAYPVFP